jgi:RNA polymerase sigma-70 factor (ECF subfamily)
MTCVADNMLPADSFVRNSAIDSEDIDAAVQRCLNRLARATDDVDARAIVRELLGVVAGRILLLCRATLSRHYPRLARGPFNVRPEGLVGAVVERLIKAMRNVRPAHVREFFALAMKHICWELNELARGLDTQTRELPAPDEIVHKPEEVDEELSPRARRILEAINSLSQSDREIFHLVRLQEMTQADAAQVLGINVKTVQRRLKRILPHLWATLGDVPAGAPNLQRGRTLRPRFVGTEQGQRLKHAA